MEPKDMLIDDILEASSEEALIERLEMLTDIFINELGDEYPDYADILGGRDKTLLNTLTYVISRKIETTAGIVEESQGELHTMLSLYHILIENPSEYLDLDEYIRERYYMYVNKVFNNVEPEVVLGLIKRFILNGSNK